MKMNFCPKCDGIIVPKKEKGKSVLVCKGCGFRQEIIGGHDLITHEKYKKKEEVGDGVASEKNILSTYNHKCEKCGYGKAQVMDMGIFYSDEDNLILLKCGKCGACEKIGRKCS